MLCRNVTTARRGEVYSAAHGLAMTLRTCSAPHRSSWESDPATGALKLRRRCDLRPLLGHQCRCRRKVWVETVIKSNPTGLNNRRARPARDVKNGLARSDHRGQ
jgi:hypothetical protein